MSLLSRKGCNSPNLSALCVCNPELGKNVSLEITGNAPEQRERLALCMQQIAVEQSREAFSEVFAYFAPRLKSYIMRLGSDATTAEEIMQEVMLNVWRKAKQYDPKQASVSTWIFRIARNRRIDNHRKQNKPDLDAADPMLQPVQAEQPDITVNRLQLEKVVQREMATLPDEQLILLKAAFYEGLSHSEIAKTYGIPLGTVKSRIRLAFQRLRGRLESEQ